MRLLMEQTNEPSYDVVSRAYAAEGGDIARTLTRVGATQLARLTGGIVDVDEAVHALMRTSSSSASSAVGDGDGESDGVAAGAGGVVRVEDLDPSVAEAAAAATPFDRALVWLLQRRVPHWDSSSSSSSSPSSSSSSSSSSASAAVASACWRAFLAAGRSFLAALERVQAEHLALRFVTTRLCCTFHSCNNNNDSRRRRESPEGRRMVQD